MWNNDEKCGSDLEFTVIFMGFSNSDWTSAAALVLDLGRFWEVLAIKQVGQDWICVILVSSCIHPKKIERESITLKSRMLPSIYIYIYIYIYISIFRLQCTIYFTSIISYTGHPTYYISMYIRKFVLFHVYSIHIDIHVL